MNWKSTAYIWGQKLIGSRVQEYLDEFFRLEKIAVSEYRELQQQRLEGILRYASSQVPYYRDLVAAARPALNDFPILTKAAVRSEFQRLMSPEISSQHSSGRKDKAYSWISVQTGGSTGIPTTIIHDAEYRDRGRAARLYSRFLCGFPLGTPYLRLWGNMKDISRERESLTHRLQSYLTDEILLNAFQMEDHHAKKYVEMINASSAVHMMAYVDTAYYLAKFIRRNELRVKPLRTVMACAGTVTDERRSTLETVFNCRVHNLYGSRDCSGIACECEMGRLHSYGHNLFLEIVDDKGEPVSNGRSGRILITLLTNRGFPLIRYDMGDVGALDNTACPCGRPFPVLSRVEGRTVEFLTSTEGGYVSPLYIIHLIGVVHNSGVIRRFQLVQQSDKQFELKIVLESDGHGCSLNSAIENIRRDLQAVLGQAAIINIKLVDDISSTPSGKFLYTLRQIPGEKVHS